MTPTPTDYGAYTNAIVSAEDATQALREAAADLAAVRKALDPHRQSVPPDSECQRSETDVEVIERLVAERAEWEKTSHHVSESAQHWTRSFNKIMAEIGWPHGSGEPCTECILDWIRKHKDTKPDDAAILLGLRAAAVLTADHDCGEEHDACLDALRRKLKRLTPEAAERLVRADGPPDDIKPLRGLRFSTMTLESPPVTDTVVVSHDDDVHVESHVNPTILTATLVGPFPDGLWAECRITNVRRDAGIRVFAGEQEVHALEQRAKYTMMPYALGWEPKRILGPTHDPAEVTVTVKASARRTGATFGPRELRLSRSPIVSPRRDYTYTVTEVWGAEDPVDWSATATTPKIDVGQVWEAPDGSKEIVSRLPPRPITGPTGTGCVALSGVVVVVDKDWHVINANDCKLVAGPGSPWSNPTTPTEPP